MSPRHPPLHCALSVVPVWPDHSMPAFPLPPDICYICRFLCLHSNLVVVGHGTWYFAWDVCLSAGVRDICSFVITSTPSGFHFLLVLMSWRCRGIEGALPSLPQCRSACALPPSQSWVFHSNSFSFCLVFVFPPISCMLSAGMVPGLLCHHLDSTMGVFILNCYVVIVCPVVFPTAFLVGRPWMHESTWHHVRMWPCCLAFGPVSDGIHSPHCIVVFDGTPPSLLQRALQCMGRTRFCLPASFEQGRRRASCFHDCHNCRCARACVFHAPTYQSPLYSFGL